MAGGKYVWLGMKVTGRNTLKWDDGTRYSYSKFLPPGNSMLKSKFVGAGVFVRNRYHAIVSMLTLSLSVALMPLVSRIAVTPGLSRTVYISM